MGPCPLTCQLIGDADGENDMRGGVADLLMPELLSKDRSGPNDLDGVVVNWS